MRKGIAELVNAAASATGQGFRGRPLTLDANSRLADIDDFAREAGVSVANLLTRAVLLSVRSDAPSRVERNGLTFLAADKRPAADTRYTPSASAVIVSLSAVQVRDAMVAANRALELIHDLSEANNASVFKLLGLRNLSGFVGEVVAAELCRLNDQMFLPNPNQDGYPDLLALTPNGVAYIQEKEKLGQTTEKSHWSPYPFGGVEVKATCGNTPPAKKLAKPKIGEARRHLLVSADWKAHHRNTNNLVGFFWDFVDRLPTVLAAFYRNDLTQDDWGKTITPTDEGGNVTSVSIMKKGSAKSIEGVKKMAQGWLVLPEDVKIRRELCQPRVFSLTEEEIASETSADGWEDSANAARRSNSISI